MSFRLFFRQFHWGLLLPPVMLLGISLLLLYSLGANKTEPDLHIFYRHLVFSGVGIAMIFSLARLDYRAVRSYARPLYFVCLILVLAASVFGETIRGNRGWLGLLGQTFQPVEFAKILVALYLADYFASRKGPILSLAGILPSLGIVAAPFALVMLGRDLGSALSFIALWFAALFFFNLRMRYFFIIGLCGLALGVLAWFAILSPTQKSRLTDFVQPTQDPFGTGYQVRQSVIAVGSGGLFGRGFGLGSQSQLNFLPVQETDFIFAVAAEEFGFVGVGVILVLYAALLGQMLLLVRRSEDPFVVVFVGSLVAIFLLHTLVNIGMNLRVAPVTGIPLPFLSYGGSALLANCIALGLVEAVAMTRGRSVGQ